MRNERVLLSSTLTAYPIIQRRRQMRQLRRMLATLALEAGIAAALMGALWFVCFGVWVR